MIELRTPIVVASGNRNKLAELSTIAERFGIALVAPAELAEEKGLPPPPEVDEIGTTFIENARLKARAFSKWSGLPALGDDSGLEVSALGGMPGIYSARYAGEGKSDADRVSKLLQELASALERDPSLGRRGQFRCVLSLVEGEHELMNAEGILEGTILHEPRGTGGFGYDPIIELDALGKTLAEVDFETTCARGFRAVAAENLFRRLVA